MLRRVVATTALRSRPHAAAATCALLPLTPPVQLVRWASSGATTAAPAAGTTQPRWRRDAMPPAFDVVHWNDDNVAAGHLLRVVHRGGSIALDYHRQRVRSAEIGEDGSRTANRNRAEKVVSVTLPPVYVARFLAVLEGRTDRLEVHSRFTDASFVPNTSKGAHYYTLQCTSTKPSSGTIQTVDGADVQEDAVHWTVEFDPAESLMLHRFLTLALHFNTGFGRHK
ncbi:mitochondrial RNA binding protein 2 [Novymonas esmeraldas]|uniref:Mitochondrial RNA binding protein 2 n=1 Tax=Novymonas esmeraldas TaxID=1808958 RepID=A0AAW0F0U8_9TRYP